MDDFQLLVDLHKRAKRQGPGGDVETRKAIDLAMLDPSAPLKVAAQEPLPYSLPAY